MKQIAVMLALLLCLSACGAGSQQAAVTPEAEEPVTAAEEQTPETGETETAEAAQPETEEQPAEEEQAPVQAQETAAAVPQVELAQNPESVKAEDGTEVLNTDYPVITVTVPGNDAAAEKINSSLAAAVEEYKAILSHGMSGESESLAADALEGYQMSKQEGWDWEAPYADQLTADVLRCDGQVVCFNFGSYTYAGGVHGFFHSFGRCFDVATGALLTLDNMAEEGVDLRQAMLDKVTEMSHDPSLYDPDMFFEGYEEYLPDVVDDEFTMNEQGITFTAAPYELGAYAVGQIEFTIPYDQLAGLVQSQYLPG